MIEHEITNDQFTLTLRFNKEQLSEALMNMICCEIRNDHDFLHNQILKEISFDTRDAVREVVYSNKDAIIEKVVKRATVEITKKGLPRLLERLEEE